MSSEPDKQGHKHGPDAIETYDTVCIFIRRNPFLIVFVSIAFAT